MARRYVARALETDDAILEIHGAEYPIPDAVTTPLVAKFMRLSRAIRESEDEEVLVEALERAHQDVLEFVRIRTPDANFELDPRSLGEVIAFIIGSEDEDGAPQTDVEQHVADVLTDNGNAVQVDGEDGEPPQVQPQDAEAPLALKTRSSTRSSRSGNGSGGRQATTGLSSGVTSVSTSSTSSVT